MRSKYILSLLLICVLWPTSIRAEEAKPADMSTLLGYLQPTPRAGSKEAMTTQAGVDAASGYTDASRLAFLGLLQGSAARQTNKPGFTNDVTLNLPAQFGGPQTSHIVSIPKYENTFLVSWAVPIFNLQAIRGLDVAARSREQSEAMTLLQKETYVRGKVNLILQYETALKLKSVRRDQIDVATSRLATMRQRSSAGYARGMALAEAEAALAAANALADQAQAAAEQIRIEFHNYSGEDLPTQGFGLPSFPFTPDQPFAPLALRLLSSLTALREASVAAEDAAFAPTVDSQVGRQIRQYDGAPRPQDFIALSANWTILDGGTRRRRVGEATRAVDEARADVADAEVKLKTAYDSLRVRYLGAQSEVEARQAALVAAEQAVQDSVTALRSGAGHLVDVRNADDQRFAAEFGVFKAKIDLQAIAIESLVLSGELVDYVGSVGKP